VFVIRATDLRISLGCANAVAVKAKVATPASEEIANKRIMAADASGPLPPGNEIPQIFRRKQCPTVKNGNEKRDAVLPSS
jgi:hypothetical protein